MNKVKLLKFFSNIRHEWRKLVDDVYYTNSIIEKRKAETISDIMDISDVNVRVKFAKDVLHSVRTKTIVQIENSIDLEKQNIDYSTKSINELEETLKNI